MVWSYEYEYDVQHGNKNDVNTYHTTLYVILYDTIITDMYSIRSYTCVNIGILCGLHGTSGQSRYTFSHNENHFCELGYEADFPDC